MFALLIPTGSDHDRNRLPVATLSLIGANVLMYVLSNLANYDQVAKTFGFVAAHPLPHQFLTHMFLHAGWPQGVDATWVDYANSFLHIGGNMVFLWFAGSDLEDVLGSLKFLIVYCLGGIASAMLFWFTAVTGHFPNLDEPAVGASGAISALLGLYMIRFPRFKIRLWFGAFIPFPLIMRQGIARISSLVFIGIWIVIQLILGIQALHVGGSEVAYWGHIGGFFLGVLYGLITRQWLEGTQEFLMKEADHLFYRQKWHQAMEFYQKAAQHDARCAEAFIKWALCWECTGMVKRAERVLWDALNYYKQQGWESEEAAVQEELDGMVGKARASAVPPPSSPETAPESRSQAAPNLLFRKEVKWKGKPR